MAATIPQKALLLVRFGRAEDVCLTQEGAVYPRHAWLSLTDEERLDPSLIKEKIFRVWTELTSFGWGNMLIGLVLDGVDLIEIPKPDTRSCVAFRLSALGRNSGEQLSPDPVPVTISDENYRLIASLTRAIMAMPADDSQPANADQSASASQSAYASPSASASQSAGGDQHASLWITGDDAGLDRAPGAACADAETLAAQGLEYVDLGTDYFTTGTQRMFVLRASKTQAMYDMVYLPDEMQPTEHDDDE